MTTPELYAYLRLAQGQGLGRQPSGLQMALLEREWNHRDPAEQARAEQQVRQWMDDGC